MRSLWFVFILFCIGALLIISNNNLALYNLSNMEKFLNLFSFWLEQIYSNILTITGRVVELNWIPS
jgi:hypothetical protein